mgnify:CR=1 FL=1
MYVRANTAHGVLANDKIDEIREWLATQQVDKTIDIKFRGASEEEQEVNQFIATAFTLALMLMGILLVTQFNSFYQALLVLSAVVMSTVGVLLGLVITGYPFSAIMTGVGIVALAGIIVNNNMIRVFNSKLGHNLFPIIFFWQHMWQIRFMIRIFFNIYVKLLNNINYYQLDLDSRHVTVNWLVSIAGKPRLSRGAEPRNLKSKPREAQT